MSVAAVNPIEDAIPVDHTQYVEADRRQLHSKVSSHHFLHKNQHLKYQRVPNRFFGIRDWAYLKARDTEILSEKGARCGIAFMNGTLERAILRKGFGK